MSLRLPIYLVYGVYLARTNKKQVAKLDKELGIKPRANNKRNLDSKSFFRLFSKFKKLP